MRRREFIVLVGGAAAWPLRARAQQQKVPVVGFLHPGSPEPSASLLAAFRQGVAEAGYREGENVAIEFRWAQNDYSRLPELAADLVRRQVTVIATPGSVQGPLAAKAATRTIPIVFSTGVDPVKVGLVVGLNRPGANVTGVISMTSALGAKQLAFLRELLPEGLHFGVLANPNNEMTEAVIKELRAAALSLGREIDVFNAGTNLDIDTVFASLAQKRTLRGRASECAPVAGQIEVSDLTGCAGLSKSESHGQTAFAQHRVQAAGRAGVRCRRDPLRARQAA